MGEFHHDKDPKIENKSLETDDEEDEKVEVDEDEMFEYTQASDINKMSSSKDPSHNTRLQLQILTDKTITFHGCAISK